MQDQLLAIREYQGEGYQPLIDFGSWRVAILRWGPGARPKEIEFMERHTQTDEVFVLLAGWAMLLIGGNRSQVEEIEAEIMASGKLYNVKQNTWHTALLSRDAVLLIVENCDTGVANSEFFKLDAIQRRVISGLDDYS
jgi:ureidoglycolate hydrolase